MEVIEQDPSCSILCTDARAGSDDCQTVPVEYANGAQRWQMLYSCPKPSVSSTAIDNLFSRTSCDLYGGRSSRLKLKQH